MRQAGACQPLATQHAGHLGHTGLAGHGPNHAGRAAIGLGPLADHIVMIGAGGNLGQVGDGQHLTPAPQLLHQGPHRVAHRAANAGIDLIEDQGARAHCRASVIRRSTPRVGGVQGGDGDGQRQPRQLTARGHPGQRLGCAAGMAGHQKLNRLQPLGLRHCQPVQRHLKAPSGHPQALHRLGHGQRQRARGLGPRRADALRLGQKLLLGGGQRCGQLAGVGRRFKCCQLAAPLLAQGRQLIGRAPVAPRQAHPG